MAVFITVSVHEYSMCGPEKNDPNRRLCLIFSGMMKLADMKAPAGNGHSEGYPLPQRYSFGDRQIANFTEEWKEGEL